MWNIAPGAPTPDPSILYDPATPPSLIKPGPTSPTIASLLFIDASHDGSFYSENVAKMKRRREVDR
jgi:hypothetical protein